MLSSGIRPCRQHEKQKSCLTESENISPALVSSNIEEKVGKALVSTWLRASVMHNSGLRDGNIGADIMDISNGTLLIRNERRRNVV